MTIARVKPSTWAVNDTLTSAEINAIDVTLTTALDKTVAGDTLSGAITLSGAGRVVPSVTLGSDANSTITVGGGNTVIRVTSAVTANRDYTLSATGAATNDVITIYAESSLAFTVTVKDQASATMFTIGNTDDSDGTWCSFIYVGGWRKFQSSQGSTVRQITYTSGSGTFTVPSGVTSLLVIGWGGGGGGGGGSDGDRNRVGGGGGAGALKDVVRLAATPGGSISYAVGAGGAGGTGGVVGGAAPADGSNGATSSFGSALFRGGQGGKALATASPGTTGSLGGTTGGNFALNSAANAATQVIGPQCGGHGVDSTAGRYGGASALYDGGLGGSAGADDASFDGGGGGGGGGAGPAAQGGAGGTGGDADSVSLATSGTSGSSAAANSGAGGGGGGAGGRGDVQDGDGGDGGAGGSGQLTIIWVK